MSSYLKLFLLVVFSTNLQALEVVEKSQVSSTQESADQTYENAKRGYSIQYPKGWEKNQSLPAFDIFIVSPLDAKGLSLANLSIISGDLPKEVNLDLYYSENIKNLKASIPTMKVKDSGETTVGGVPSKWIHYTREDDQTEIVHYFFISNHVAFLITNGSSKEAFKDYEETFNEIVKSFKFNKS